MNLNEPYGSKKKKKTASFMSFTSMHLTYGDVQLTTIQCIKNTLVLFKYINACH